MGWGSCQTFHRSYKKKTCVVFFLAAAFFCRHVYKLSFVVVFWVLLLFANESHVWTPNAPTSPPPSRPEEKKSCDSACIVHHTLIDWSIDWLIDWLILLLLLFHSLGAPVLFSVGGEGVGVGGSSHRSVPIGRFLISSFKMSVYVASFTPASPWPLTGNTLTFCILYYFLFYFFTLSALILP